MTDPRLSRLDILDGVGTRRFTQLDANRALDRVSDDPHMPAPYVAHDLPGVDPHGYFMLGRLAGALGAMVILYAAGIATGWLIFGVWT